MNPAKKKRIFSFIAAAAAAVLMAGIGSGGNITEGTNPKWIRSADGYFYTRKR